MRLSSGAAHADIFHAGFYSFFIRYCGGRLRQSSFLERDPVLYFLLTAGSLTVMAGAVMAPILPELIDQLQLDQGWAGSLVSVHYLTLALFSPLLGIWADRHGQLRLLMPSLIIYAIAGVGGAFLTDYWLLLLDRGLLGMASGGVAAASLGLLSRRYTGETRNQAIAYAAMAITLANIVYPLMAVGLGHFNWRFAFGLYGLSALLALSIGTVFRTSDLSSNQATDSTPSPALQVKPADFLKSPDCLRIFCSLTAISAVVYGSIIYLPIYLKTTLDSDILWNGLILAVQGIGAALSSGFMIRPLARRFGSLGTAASGLGLMALFLVLFPSLNSLPLLMLSSGLFGVAFGLVTPSLYTLLANIAPPNLQSSILATGIGMGFLGQFLSPLFLGLVLNHFGLSIVFYSCAAIALVVGIGLLFPLKTAVH
jgi:MFS transporter, ACDE family, multidrug resistance protein